MENLNWLIEKSKQCTAYLEGKDTADPDHPDHERNIYRAKDRAKDIVTELEAYLESLEEKEWEAKLTEWEDTNPLFDEV